MASQHQLSSGPPPTIHVVRFNLDIHVIKEGVYEWKIQIGEALLIGNSSGRPEQRRSAAAAATVLKECHRRSLNIPLCVEGISRYMLDTEEQRKNLFCEDRKESNAQCQSPLRLRRAPSLKKGRDVDALLIEDQSTPLILVEAPADTVANAYRLSSVTGEVTRIPINADNDDTITIDAKEGTAPSSPKGSPLPTFDPALSLTDATELDISIIDSILSESSPQNAVMSPSAVFKQTRLDSIVKSFAVLFAQPHALDHITNDEIIHMVRYGHLFVHNDKKRAFGVSIDDINNPGPSRNRVAALSANEGGKVPASPPDSPPSSPSQTSVHQWPPAATSSATVHGGALSVVSQPTFSLSSFGLGLFSKLQWSSHGTKGGSGAINMRHDAPALIEDDPSAVSTMFTTAVIINLVSMCVVLCAFMGTLALINRLHIAYENSMAVYTETNQRGSPFSDGTPLWAVGVSRGSTPQITPQLLPSAAPVNEATELKLFSLLSSSESAPASGNDGAPSANNNDITDGATDVPSSRVDSSDASNYQREATDTYPMPVQSPTAAEESKQQPTAGDSVGDDGGRNSDSSTPCSDEYPSSTDYGREESSFTPAYANSDLTLEAIKQRNTMPAATHAFQEDYTIVKKIGNGVDGSVFVAKSKITDTYYAVKAICIAGDADKRKREATLHSKLDDSSIPRFYHTWIEEMPVSAIIEMEMFPDIQSLLDYASVADHEDSSGKGGGGGGGYAFSMCSDMATDYGEGSDNGNTTNGSGDRASTPTKEAVNAEREAIQAARDLREAQLRNATIPVLFIKMEYFRAGTLKDYISDRSRHSYDINSLQWKKVAWQLLLHVATGIRYMHQMKIIHRDVKPSNIFIANTDFSKLQRGSGHHHRLRGGKRRMDSEDMLSTDTTTEFWEEAKLTAEDFLAQEGFPPPTLKLGDFGRSVDTTNPDYRKEWLASEESLPHRVSNYEVCTDTFCFGTPPYASPEQMSGRLLGFQTDVFSLGIIAIELFQNFQTDHEKYATIEKALAYDPHFKSGETSRLPPNMQGPEFRMVSSMLSESPHDRPIISFVVGRIREILENLQTQSSNVSGPSHRSRLHASSTASVGCPSAGSSTTTKVHHAFPFSMPHTGSMASLGTPTTGTGGTCRFPFVASMEFDPPSPSAATVADGGI
eukprot:GILI01004613.1.p1 GENE.GILI01004613.1~~GILI01004613.1.p1  ORF type:complete len:1311 (+),score=283.83 GILI01004613.1:459-3935(+)